MVTTFIAPIRISYLAGDVNTEKATKSIEKTTIFKLPNNDVQTCGRMLELKSEGANQFN